LSGVGVELSNPLDSIGYDFSNQNGSVFFPNIQAGNYVASIDSNSISGNYIPIISKNTVEIAGCGLEKRVEFLVKDKELSTQNPNLATKIHFFPNPFDEEIHFSTHFKKTNDVHLRVYSALGNLIFDQNLGNQTNISVKTADFPSGILMFELISGAEMTSFLGVKK
jgi:hypothetical protein